MNFPLLVIFLLVVALENCDAALEHLKDSKKCIKVKECEPVMRLLSVPMIKKKIYREVRDAKCGYEDGEYKIYCDVEKIIHRPERFEAVLAAFSNTNTPTVISKSTTIDKLPNYKLLDHENCGLVDKKYRSQVSTRILGGRVTGINEFPWMALLAYSEDDHNNTDSLQFRCGATVINRNHVMTAAHCVTGLRDNLKVVGVRIGEHDFSTEPDCENGRLCNAKHKDFGIDEIFSHSNFSLKNLHDDIAIIRLNGSIDFSSTHVRPICLPLDEEQTLPRRGIVTGWGSTENDSPSSEVLLKVTLPILPYQRCEEAYTKAHPYIKIWHKQFCAGGIRGIDSCTGDSGGPLQTIAKYRGSSRMVQRGIISYGRKACGMADSPGVYTNVARYVRWILDKIGA